MTPEKSHVYSGPGPNAAALNIEQTKNLIAWLELLGQRIQTTVPDSPIEWSKTIVDLFKKEFRVPLPPVMSVPKYLPGSDHALEYDDRPLKEQYAGYVTGVHDAAWQGDHKPFPESPIQKVNESGDKVLKDFHENRSLKNLSRLV